MATYLESLTIQLASGLANLPEHSRQQHANFISLHQQPDGGFRGREGGSDIYYTSFAIRTLALLGELSANTASQCTGYLLEIFRSAKSIVDLFSLVSSVRIMEETAGNTEFATTVPNWQEEIITRVENFKRDDHGYVKSDLGNASSTYFTFLALLIYQAFDRTIPNRKQTIDFIMSQKRPDGGFVEIRPMRRGGMNPTAAAVATLNILDYDLSQLKDEVVRFILSLKSLEGGLLANTQIPIADLLSTFTGIQTLNILDSIQLLDKDTISEYAQSLESPNGGFRGAIWDEETDCEYTFYGLGTIAIIKNLENS